MFRQIARSPTFSRLATAASSEQYICKACVLQARQAWLPSSIVGWPTRRHYNPGAAPTTEIELDRRPLAATKDNLKEVGRSRGFDEDDLRSRIHNNDHYRWFAGRLDAVVKFVETYEKKSVGSRRADGSSDADIVQIAMENKLTIDQIFVTAFMLRKSHERINKKLAGHLMTALSDIGDMRATGTIVFDALHQSKRNQRVWAAPAVVRARTHLREAMQAPPNVNIECQTLVLEARIALSLGDEDRAVQLLQEAVPAAEEIDKPSETDRLTLDIQERYNLFTPWRELIEIYEKRMVQKRSSKQYEENLELLQKYILIGCEQEDPLAHWAATKFYKRLDGDRQHVPTSRWLYHTLKAGASGHLEAAFELAKYYQTSGWRYIEDDVPDHLKPTPFDREPPAEAGQKFKALSGYTGAIKSLLLGAESKSQAPHEDLFYDATFPNKAVDRLRLAWEWLHICIARNYAPAFLIAGGICLDKTLWHQANAPQCAMDLSDKRYGFEYEPVPPEQEEKNPFYDPERAKICLRAVFHAWDCKSIMIKSRRAIVERRAARDQIPASEEILDDLTYHEMRRVSPERAHWFKDPYTWDLYEGLLDDMYKKAAYLCKQHKLVIYNDSGTLVYDGREL